MINTYKIVNIIEEQDKTKKTIRVLLKGCGINVENIIIKEPEDMCSYADKGIEVRIISVDFRKMDLFTKTGLLSRLALEINPKIRAKAYTPAEYQASVDSLHKLQKLTKEKHIIGPRQG